MFPARKAISYISNKQDFQDYKCVICFNLSLDVFQCQGPCQKYYCISCIDRYSSERYCCSFCSNGQTFKWTVVQLNNIQFICPYTLDKHVSLRSLNQFQEHCFNCKEMKQQEKSHASCLQDYKCNYGHRLIFISEGVARQIFKGRSIFNALTHSQCESCLQTTLCRSYCSQCSKLRNSQVLFCTKCRNVPATKTYCPIGHGLTQKRYRSVSSICDFCGFSDKFSTKLAFTDGLCNFDICFRCYSKLPIKNKLNPLKNQFSIEKIQTIPPPTKQITTEDNDVYGL